MNLGNWIGHRMKNRNWKNKKYCSKQAFVSSTSSFSFFLVWVRFLSVRFQVILAICLALIFSTVMHSVYKDKYSNSVISFYSEIDKNGASNCIISLFIFAKFFKSIAFSGTIQLIACFLPVFPFPISDIWSDWSTNIRMVPKRTLMRDSSFSRFRCPQLFFSIHGTLRTFFSLTTSNTF